MPRGDPQPGNGWDDYESGILSISPITGLYPARELLDAGPKADRQKARALTSQFAGALQALQRGASKARAHQPRGWDSHNVFIVNAWPMGGSATLHARLLAEEGRTREAADFLLDTCQFGMDATKRNGHLMEAYSGISVLSGALDELRSLIDGGRFQREDILDVERQLDLLDQTFHRPHNRTSSMRHSRDWLSWKRATSNRSWRVTR